MHKSSIHCSPCFWETSCTTAPCSPPSCGTDGRKPHMRLSPQTRVKILHVTGALLASCVLASGVDNLHAVGGR